MDGFRPIVIPPAQPTPDGGTPGPHGPAALLPAVRTGLLPAIASAGAVSILIGL